MVFIEYYGPSTQFTRIKSETLPASNLREVFNLWESKYTEAFTQYTRQHCGITVNLEYVDADDDVPLTDKDEIAVIPPVSSG